MEQLLRGLFVSVAGMTVVFLGLAVLMVVMMALGRLFRGQEGATPPSRASALGSEASPAAPAGPGGDKALAAALGAAIVLVQGAPASSALRRQPSPWGAAGRHQQAQPWRGKGRP
ncbi:MAG: OadG family protein [Chloroflexi bacterium]|nr:OadG family protein [Chloroflexota bacterium]